MRNADFQSAVSQVSNLQSVVSVARVSERGSADWEIGDTADWKSALCMRATRLLLYAFVALGASSCAHTKVKVAIRAEPEAIRGRLLEYTPRGTKAEEVMHFVQTRLRHHGNLPKYNKYMGALLPGGKGTVGSRSVEIFLGAYGQTGVFARWGFDDQDTLIEIVVSKARDSL